jgi:hypothetical protein
MSSTFKSIVELTNSREMLISVHGYEELEKDDLSTDEVIRGLSEGFVIEDYPDYHKGPAILVLQKDSNGLPIHVVWGIPRGCSSPAVLVTAYRPDSNRWSSDFRRRLSNEEKT